MHAGNLYEQGHNKTKARRISTQLVYLLTEIKLCDNIAVGPKLDSPSAMIGSCFDFRRRGARRAREASS